jgi:hypothetical protein
MGPWDPRNLAILWFTIGNYNPWFKAWWEFFDGKRPGSKG